MTPIDGFKALGAAALALALNMLVTTAAIFAWSMLVEPGHPPEFYREAAPGIAARTAPAGGALLLGWAAFALGRRRPSRNAVLFAGAMGLAYVLIDAASALPMAAPAQVFTPLFAGSMAAALAASLLGGMLASRSRR
jgi:hypothetical protein